MARKVSTTKKAKEKKEPAKKSEKTPAKAKKKAVKKKAATRKTKTKAADVKRKAYWGVFNQSLKRVVLFEYSERKKADKKAAELSASGKSPHFVQLVKEAID